MNPITHSGESDPAAEHKINDAEECTTASAERRLCAALALVIGAAVIFWGAIIFIISQMLA